LSIEPKTVFGVWSKKGRFSAVDEDVSQEQYRYLIETLAKSGYEHYEISNFARKGYKAKHNTAYWKNVPYIGIGPSAHSYNGSERRWNISNNTEYLQRIEKNDFSFYEEEELSVNDQFNDYVLTSLRTNWGINPDYIKSVFGNNYLNHVMEIRNKYDTSCQLIENNSIRIAEKDWLVSDSLISEFMFT
jgi:oxygen-independent coproporphyrinogen III oxidase